MHGKPQAGIAQLVERNLAKVEVASSSLVSRSKSSSGPPARWQSGHAAACKAVYAGSIPTPASKFGFKARVVKSVDTGDLKSPAHKACQFESGLGHHFNLY